MGMRGLGEGIPAVHLHSLPACEVHVICIRLLTIKSECVPRVGYQKVSSIP